MERMDDRLVSWATDLEDEARRQVLRTARLPVIHGVALMPDAHYGIGATVGSVAVTDGAVIPSAVGVDIGCGMIASRTSLVAGDLPDDLGPFLDDLPRAVPAGVGAGHGLRAKGRDLVPPAWSRWYRDHPTPRSYGELLATAADQFGTLGSGNHFVEVCLDGDDGVWLMLHSGSRGIGNKLASQHIAVAKRAAALLERRLEDPDLAWFVEGTPEFQRYLADLRWCQDYAAGNREAMMDALYRVLSAYVPKLGERQRVNCHHNYCAREVVDGQERWVTRKGAIRAGAGELGIIPGSMGTRSYIVAGKGNPASYQSCSHGAGRRLSRGKARRSITVADFKAQMSGVRTWQAREARALLDEAPSAYKPIDEVMAAQADLVDVVAELRQVANYKGVR